MRRLDIGRSRQIPFLIFFMLFASCDSGPTGTGAGSFVLSSTILEFSAADYEKSVTIRNQVDTPISWSVRASDSWLSLSPAAGTLPEKGNGSFRISLNRAAIPQGTHRGALTVTAEGSSTRIEVQVEQGTQPLPMLDATNAGPLDQSIVVHVGNSGGSPLEWSLTAGAPWASIHSGTGRTAPGEETDVVVSINRSGLTQGTYRTTLHLSSNAGPLTKSVDVQVGPGAGISLNPALLNFGRSATQLPLQISNPGSAPLDWTGDPGSEWVSLSKSSGQIAPGSSAIVVLNVSRNQLPHGIHQAAVQFSSNAGSAAATVTVASVPIGTPVDPAAPKIALSPRSLSFEDSNVLNIFVYNQGGETLEWDARPDHTWLTVTPDAGRIPPGSGSPVSLQLNRAALPVGLHQASLHFNSNGGSATASIQARISADSPSPPSPPTPPPPPTPNPMIQVTPNRLNFGSSATQIVLRLQNENSIDVHWSASASSGWLNVPSSGTIAARGYQNIVVKASRATLLAAGQYEATITVAWDQGVLTIPVDLEVIAAPPSSDPEIPGLDPTGRTDITNALNTYLAGLPPGSVVELSPGARYKAEGVIRLIDRHDLTIEGNGAIIFATTDGRDFTPPDDLKREWPRARSHLEITRGSNIVVRNLTIQGANPDAGSESGAYSADLEGQHGIDIRAVDGLMLDRVTVTDTYGDFVYMGMRDGRWASDVTIKNSHLERSGRQGIAITGAENVTVMDTYIGEVGRSVIDLEPGGAAGGAMNILFTRNTFGPCRHLLLSAGGAGPDVSNVSLIENRMTGIGLKIQIDAADGSRRSNYRIVDNYSEVRLSLPVAAIRFHRVDGIEVHGNHQEMVQSRKMPGVSACESTALNIGGNVFPGSVVEYITRDSCPSGVEE